MENPVYFKNKVKGVLQSKAVIKQSDKYLKHKTLVNIEFTRVLF